MYYHLLDALYEIENREQFRAHDPGFFSPPNLEHAFSLAIPDLGP